MSVVCTRTLDTQHLSILTKIYPALNSTDALIPEKPLESWNKHLTAYLAIRRHVNEDHGVPPLFPNEP